MVVYIVAYIFIFLSAYKVYQTPLFTGVKQNFKKFYIILIFGSNPAVGAIYDKNSDLRGLNEATYNSCFYC